jgi:hypothetical protein
MKKLLPVFLLIFLASPMAAQGLEDVIVEKYYVSDANDATAVAGGTLPSGSITYRIYVDMAPGYKLRSVYCDIDKAQDLRIQTTTLFFNNAYAGEKTANEIQNTDLDKNTVMLDSWISLGGTSANTIGVIKTEDTDGAILNSGGFLQNEDTRAGTPIKLKDGMISGAPVAITRVGLDEALTVFDAVNAGPAFYATDGSWFNTSGAVGPTPDNRVLIAQVTTNGVLSYSLNFLIIRTSDSKSFRYVHSNDAPGDILCEKCMSLGVPTTINKTYSNTALTGKKTDLRIFPNPASDHINIDLGDQFAGQNCRIAIYDIIGNLVLNTGNKGNTGNLISNIDISSLLKGMYIIKLQMDDGYCISRRFIRNR